LEGLDNPEEAVDVKLLQGVSHSVKRLCETRWKARVDIMSSIMTNYKSVHTALSEIESVSTSDARTNASGYHQFLEDPEFIVALVVAQCVLSLLKPLTLFLQKTDCNMVDAFESKILIELLKEKRTEEAFSELYSRSSKIADALDIDLTPRGGVGRQTHRENAGVGVTPEQHWRINLFFPFIDHVINEMERLFPTEMKDQMLGFYLKPKYVALTTPQIINSMFEAFADVTDLDAFKNEISRWTKKTEMLTGKSLQETVRITNKDLYPNINLVLRLHLFLPVTSVCCEQSFSSLRQLNTWEHVTMSSERLCGLALLHVHRDTVNSDRERGLKKFDSSGHRRVGKFWVGNE
jgi:hypothetical protein